MTTMLAEILEGEPLNTREAEILAGAAEGETAAQTGARLYLSPETVKSYRKRLSRSSARGTGRTQSRSPCAPGSFGNAQAVATSVCHSFSSR